MNVGITGINGLVGSFMARKFLEEGHKIVGVVRENADLQLIKDILEDIDLIKGELIDVGITKQLVSSCDWIIHSAAMVSFDGSIKKMFLANVEITRNLVDESLQNEIKKFIYVSSVSAIGYSDTMKELDETYQWKKDQDMSVYAKTKYLGELEAWRGNAEGLPVLVVNPSVILGPVPPDRSSGKVFSPVLKKQHFYTEGTFNYVDVRDVADFTYDLAHNDQANGHRVILNAQKINISVFYKKVSDFFNLKAPGIKVRTGLVYLAVCVLRAVSILTGRTPSLTKEVVKAIKKDTFYSNGKSLNYTNLDYKNIDESLEWISRNYREAGIL